MSEQFDAGKISSKEIIRKTGISRATLNNYIKLGILPAPVVMKAGPELAGTKKIGYFPASVLDRIMTVRKLKRQGESIQQIAEHFRSADNGTTTAAELPGHTGEVRSGQEVLFERQPSHAGEDLNSILQLSLEDIDSPAFFINDNYDILRINTKAEEFFNQPVGKINVRESRNLFRLLLDWQFQSAVKNWLEVVASHLAVCQADPEKPLAGFLAGMPQDVLQELSSFPGSGLPPADQFSANTPLDLVLADNTRRSYELQRTVFKTGTLFVYLPSEKTRNQTLRKMACRSNLINGFLAQGSAALVPFCVLVATLQDSDKIRAELPAEVYLELINEFWCFLGPVFAEYQAVCGKYGAEDGMLHYFIRNDSADYLTAAVRCSLELHEKTEELSRKWKERRRWRHDLLLNMAIDEAEDFFGPLYSYANIEFAALGDSVDRTARLAEFAHSGSIWTTKNVIGKLPDAERRLLVYGVQRGAGENSTFGSNSFARIMDLLAGGDSSRFADIVNLPVTRIVGRSTG